MEGKEKKNYRRMCMMKKNGMERERKRERNEGRGRKGLNFPYRWFTSSSYSQPSAPRSNEFRSRGSGLPLPSCSAP